MVLGADALSRAYSIKRLLSLLWRRIWSMVRE